MKHFTPREAFEFLNSTPQALMVDCRSEMEFLFVGHPAGALHVAWNDGPDWEVNPHFVGQVKKVAGTNHAHRPIVLICRSGNRSIEAGEALERAGFTDVWAALHPQQAGLTCCHLADLSDARANFDQRIDYVLLDSSKPLDFALLEYLSRREWLARVR